MSTNRRYDPYGSCTDGCNHDLARGVLVSELLAADGPDPVLEVIPGLGLARALVFDGALPHGRHDAA